MNLGTFFEKFDQFAEAPNAVAKMRELILQLAVQGKLVEQCSDDEPAEILLERIEVEKSKRVREGTLRNPKQTSPVTDDDQDLDLPLNWQWVRIGQVVKLWNGFAFKSSDFQPSGIPVIRIGDLQGGVIDVSNAVCVSDDVAKTVGPDVWIPEDALLIAMSGATTGKIAFNKTGQRLLLNQRVGRLEPFLLDTNYVRFFFETIVVRNLSISFGSAIPNLSAEQINETVFPLPPLAEQKRIVTKVDELMALCDRIETQQKERDARHALLARASLARFADASTLENLNLLFHPSYAIAPADLRKTILTLAVQGKLVSQDPNDEPADTLLARLRSREAKDTGRRNKADIVQKITPSEIPFELPTGWVWERLGNIGETNIGLTYSPQDVSEVGIPVLRSSNIQNGKLDFSDLVRVKCEPKRSVMVQDDDLLICARNGSRALVGKVAVIEDMEEPAAFGAFMAIFRSEVNQYLYHFIRSPLFRQMIDEVNTTTINQITQNNLRSTPAPIPPLAEQRRIVAKVDQLMALVDQLETQLADSRATASSLMEAVVAELTAQE